MINNQESTLSSIVKKFKLFLPQLLYWFRLPGLISWFGISLGIIISRMIDLPITDLPYKKLYIGLGIITITSFSFLFIFLRLKFLKIIFAVIIGYLLYTTHMIYQTYQFDLIRPTLDHPSAECQIDGIIYSEPILKNQEYQFLTKVEKFNGSQQFLQKKLIKCYGKTKPNLYEKVRILGKYKVPQPQMNPYGFDEYTYLITNGIWGKCKVTSIEIIDRQKSLLHSVFFFFRSTIIRTLAFISDTDAQAVLQASILNETSFLTDDLKNNFKKSGLYHLIAVSGLQAGIFITFTYMILSCLFIPRNWKLIISLSVLWIYVIYIGFIPSLFRAALMATIVTFSLFLQKKSHGLHVLGVAGSLYLIMNPQGLFLPGYQLSFFATFGMVILYPLFIKNFSFKIKSPLINLPLQKLQQALYLSVACFITTLPVLLYHFGQISFFGFIANIYAVTMMTLSMWIFFIAAFLNTISYTIAFPFAKISEFAMKSILYGAQGGSFEWSSRYFIAPLPEVIILFSLFWIGFILINKKYLKHYVMWTPPLFFIVIAIFFFTRSKMESTTITFFSNKKSVVKAISWQKGNVDLFLWNTNDFSSLLSWIHHQPSHKTIRLLTPRSNDSIILPDFLNNSNRIKIYKFDNNVIGKSPNLNPILLKKQQTFSEGFEIHDKNLVLKIKNLKISTSINTNQFKLSPNTQFYELNNTSYMINLKKDKPVLTTYITKGHPLFYWINR